VTDTFRLHHDLWEYNPLTDNWEQKADLPITLSSHGTLKACCINGKGYLLASFNADNFWEYDPQNNSWTKRSAFPGGDVLNLVAFVIGNKGYFGTGFKTSDYITSIWEYDPEKDLWSKKADFPGTPRSGAVGFSIAGKGYIGLGNSSGKFPKDFWLYDPAKNIWTQTDSCGYGAEGAFAFSIAAKGYVGTGVFDSQFWEYAPNLTSVKKLPEPPVKNLFIHNAFMRNDNKSAIITYSLEFPATVSIELFDFTGKRVACLQHEYRQPGNHSTSFHTGTLPSGTYLCKLSTLSVSLTRKLVLQR
jgi:N-acetylneuraminic acid mutarotase